jgi:hypothetical protein
MLIDFQQHYTPPELLKGEPGKVTVDLDRDGNPHYLLNPLLADLAAHVSMMDASGIDAGVLSCHPCSSIFSSTTRRRNCSRKMRLRSGKKCVPEGAMVPRFCECLYAVKHTITTGAQAITELAPPRVQFAFHIMANSLLRRSVTSMAPG